MDRLPPRSKGDWTWTSVATRLLQTAFPDDSDEVATWPVCDRLLPQTLMAADHAERLDVEPEARLWLLSRVAGYLLRRGRYRQALTLQEQALAGYRQLLGDDHLDTLTSMRYLDESHRDPRRPPRRRRAA